MDFPGLGVCNWILDQLKEIGIRKPTSVQLSCIPEILAGRDCIGVAKTGSGKTLAFAIPILQTLSEDPYGVYAVILTPTRELAYQINDQLKIVGIGMGLRTCVVVGGRSILEQQKELGRRPHIVIGTPGRLADHVESNSTFSLAKVKYLVLDEADRLLEPNSESFTEQLSTIIGALPSNRQTLLFTATNTPIVGETIAACPNNPFIWECDTRTEQKTVESLDQKFILTPRDAKNVYLFQLVMETREKSPRDSIMVFVKSCMLAELLYRTFRKLGIGCSSLHGMKKQRERMAALSSFKSNHTKVLIATDVASRGLDIPEVQLVINHNVPKDPRDYVHRVGRTARAGKGGRSVTLVIPTQVGLLQAVEAETNVRMEELPINEEKIAEILLQVNTTVSECSIDLGTEDWDEKKNMNKRKKLILKGLDPDTVEAEKQKRFLDRKKEYRHDRLKMEKKAKKAWMENL